MPYQGNEFFQIFEKQKPQTAYFKLTCFLIEIELKNKPRIPLIKFIMTNPDYHNGQFSASKAQHPRLVMWNKTEYLTKL